MADVKWIKITTDIFDDEKILLIESLPEADSIIVIWFKLLCLAGKQNNSGVFTLGDRIAYTDKMLATIFRRKEATVQMALKTFEEFGMVELIDGVITIPNWGKHQNLDQIETKKKYMRGYMAEYRKKQKALTCKSNSKTNGKANVRQAEEDIERDKEEDKERDIKENNKRKDYEEIAKLFNSLCPSLPSIKTISDARKKAIQLRCRKYSLEDFITVFKKAEASAFLKGANDRNWNATFDWLIKEANFVKVLEGNYDNKPDKPKGKGQSFPQRQYDYDALQRMLRSDPGERVEDNPELLAEAEALKKELAEIYGKGENNGS